KHEQEIETLAGKLKHVLEDIEGRKAPEVRRSITWEQVEHDASHLKLVELLRPTSARTLPEAKVWFLTQHYALARFAHSVAGPNNLPTALMFEQFHQLLRTVLPRSEGDRAA